MPFNPISHRPAPLPADRTRSRNLRRRRRASAAARSLLLPAILLLLLPLTAGAQTTTDICDRHDKVEDAILDWFLEEPPCTAVNLSEVTSITLFGGITDENPLQASDFAGLINLSRVGIYKTGLTTLPENLFQGLTNLSRITIDGNGELTGVPANFFQGLTNLSHIYFNNNAKFATLHAGMFQGLTNLTQITFRWSKISGAVPTDLFAGLTNLEVINLETNQITTLPDGIFDGLVNLEEIDLSDNDISTLPTGIFEDLQSLTRLDLDNHQITTLPDGTFEGLFNLRDFNLIHEGGTTITLSVSMAANEAGDGAIFSMPKGAPGEVDLDITIEERGDTDSATSHEIIFPTGHTQYDLPPNVLHAAGFAAGTELTVRMYLQLKTHLSGVAVAVRTLGYTAGITMPNLGTPDANDDDAVDASDALILYYAYSLRSSLGNGR